jgi:hypothetical protein
MIPCHGTYHFPRRDPNPVLSQEDEPGISAE